MAKLDLDRNVEGRCPACGWCSLMLGMEGHVTCTRLDCPNRWAADEMLHATHKPMTHGLLYTDRVGHAHYSLDREHMPDIPRPERDVVIAILRHAVERLEEQGAAAREAGQA